jgi:peptidyl-tRNA hydrolase
VLHRYEKLYIVTRRDLSPGLQAAQVAHAAFQFGYEHRPLATQWLQESNFLIILSVEDEVTLKERAAEAESRNLPVTYFYEPDIGNQLTAIAVAPSPVTVELMADLPLALREYGGFSNAGESSMQEKISET